MTRLGHYNVNPSFKRTLSEEFPGSRDWPSHSDMFDPFRQPHPDHPTDADRRIYQEQNRPVFTIQTSDDSETPLTNTTPSTTSNMAFDFDDWGDGGDEGIFDYKETVTEIPVPYDSVAPIERKDYYERPSNPKYGRVWKSLKSPLWVGKKEYKYDTSIVDPDAIVLEKARSAQAAYQAKLEDRYVLMNEINALKVQEKALDAIIEKYPIVLSPSERQARVGQRNKVRGQKESKQSMVRILESEMAHEKKRMHAFRDQIAEYYVKEGPLTSENRAFMMMLGGVALGYWIIGSQVDFSTLANLRLVDSKRKKTPIGAVFS
jgi:hypothetical protein